MSNQGASAGCQNTNIRMGLYTASTASASTAKATGSPFVSQEVAAGASTTGAWRTYSITPTAVAAGNYIIGFQFTAYNTCGVWYLNPQASQGLQCTGGSAIAANPCTGTVAHQGIEYSTYVHVQVGSTSTPTSTPTATPTSTPTPTNCGSIGYGVLVLCSIASAGQTQSYPFAGASGEKIFARLADTGWTSFSPKVSVYRPDGTLLCTSNSNNVAELACTLDATGTHTVVAQDTYTATGSYALYLQRTSSPLGTLSLFYGVNTAGSLSAGAVDDYVFAGTSGTPIFLRHADANNTWLSPTLIVYRPDGTQLCAASGPDTAELNCILDATGNYLVMAADSNGNGSGSYVLYLHATVGASGTTAMSYGDNVTSTLPKGQVQALTFAGVGGDKMYLRMAEASWSTITTYPKVYAPDGTYLCGGQAYHNSESTCTLPATGTYTVLAMDYYGSGSGSYVLYLQRLNNPVGTTSISYGVVADGALSAATVEDYTIAATTGDEFYVRMAQRGSSAFDAKVQVYRPNGTLLCSNWGNSWTEKLCALDTTGTYTLLFMDNSGSGSGTYSAYVQRTNGPVNAVSAALNQGYSSTLGTGDVQQLAIGAKTGDTLQFQMSQSGALQPRFNVFRPDGTLLCSAESTTTATVACYADETGAYAILPMDKVGNHSGVYDLVASWLLNAPSGPFQPFDPTSNPSHPVAQTKDPISTRTGDFSHEHTDLSVPGRGASLEFARYYHSGSTVVGDMGVGWTQTYDMRLVPTAASVDVYYPQGDATTFVFSNGAYVARPGVYDGLVQNGDGTFTLTTPAQTKYNFTSLGRLTSIVDRSANTMTIGYDVNGHLSAAMDAGGRSLSFTVDGIGRITQVSDPLSRIVGFQYDANGDLVQVMDVKGGVTSYAYASHQMTSLTDANGHVAVQNIFDAAGRDVEQRDALGAVTCVYYGIALSYSSSACPGVSPVPSGSQTIVVDPRGGKATYTYDSSNETSQVTDALGGTTTYSYDGNYNSTCVTDPLGHRTSRTYDVHGNLTQLIDAANTTSSCGLIASGKAWTYTYDSMNNLLVKTDPLGRTTTSTYNSSGNLTSVTNDLNQTITFVVNSNGAVASATDPLNHTTTFAYDAYGNQTTATDPLLHSTTSTYDLGGRNLTTTDALSHTTTYTYDVQNNVLTVTDALGNVTTTTYNAKGLPTSVTDANRTTLGSPEAGAQCGTAGTGNGVDDDADGRVDDGCPNSMTTYDNADRVTSVVDAAGNSVSYGYDANGNRFSLTNTRGKVTTYAYDSNNRLTSATDALSRTTTYGYDVAGRRTSRTDAKSQTTTYSYDVLDRLALIDHPVGTADVSFTYDALGNRLTMIDGTGTTTFTYDHLYHPTAITDGAANVVSYAYDGAGRRISITYPGSTGAVTYAYDGANRLTGVADWLSNTTSYAYDNANRLTSTTLGNGLISDRTYDNVNRLLTLANRNGGTTISSYTYTLDSVGNRAQMVDTSGTTTYGYDGLYRLTGTTYPNTDVQSYTYDALGNRLTKVNNGSTTNYSYDDADQMTLAGGVSHPYDNDGNQTAAGSDTFSWDAENRLTGTNIGGVASSYVYNGGGLRTSRTIGGVTTSYAWDLSSGLPQVLQDSSGNKYIYGLDLISQVDGSASLTYFLTDGLGSTTGLANGSRTMVGGYTYDVFGAVRAQTGTTTERSYTGEQNDPTGLEYLRARYYDAASGIFLGRDPAPSANAYTYGDADPVNYADPSGECRVETVLDKGDHWTNDLLGNAPYIVGGGAGFFDPLAGAVAGLLTAQVVPDAWYHAYIVTADPITGEKTINEGGNYLGSGRLRVNSYRFGDSPDARSVTRYSRNPKRLIYEDSGSCGSINAKLNEAAKYINLADRQYNWRNMNSNSAASDLLRLAGFTPAQPKGWAPGWGEHVVR
jgi:RHS repeat-associated protein